MYAECKDPDGKVRSFDWTVNGERLSLSGNRLSLLKSSFNDTMPKVTLVGYDDAGAASEPVSQ